MPKETKGKQKNGKENKRNSPGKRRMKPGRKKFIFGRELSIDQIMAGIKVMCEEAGIPFVEKRKE
jgi:hypothetical protein